MVTDNIQRRNRREFSLDAIQRLAADKAVAYGSRDVLRDTENHHYSKDDVCACLMNLKEENYHESIHYGDKKGWLDVYKCNWPAPLPNSSLVDDLYIKLKLNRDCILIVITSFHPEGTS